MKARIRVEIVMWNGQNVHLSHSPIRRDAGLPRPQRSSADPHHDRHTEQSTGQLQIHEAWRLHLNGLDCKDRSSTIVKRAIVRPARVLKGHQLAVKQRRYSVARMASQNGVRALRCGGR